MRTLHHIDFLLRAAITCLPLVTQACLGSVEPRTYEWKVFAGNAGGSGANDGPFLSAQFAGPTCMTMDASGTIYVADTNNHSIRKLSPSGMVSTLAGRRAEPGASDGPRSEARFRFPRAIAATSDGYIFVADTDNHVIRKIAPDGSVSTLAGAPGSPGFADGTGALARFNFPRGICLDPLGNLVVADSSNHIIRRISLSGEVMTITGEAGVIGSSDGIPAAARFRDPRAVTAAADGTLYVADTGNHTVRRIDANGDTSTLAGLAGSYGSSNGSGSAARFWMPTAICLDRDGNLIVADQFGGRVRLISPAGVVSFAGGEGVRFTGPTGLLIQPDGSILVAEPGRSTISRLDFTPAVTLFAGSPTLSGSDDGVASAARFNLPGGVSLASDGGLIVADTGNHTIRRVSSTGQVSTIAGSAGCAGITNGKADQARFNQPGGAVASTNGSIYVADTGNDLIRRVDPTGEVVTFAGAPGTLTPPDEFLHPSALSLKNDGSLVVADFNQMRAISPSGTVTRLAGSTRHVIIRNNVTYTTWVQLSSGSGDGTGSNALIGQAAGPCVGPNGHIYFADSRAHTIRTLRWNQEVTTLSGTPLTSGFADGPVDQARFDSPQGVAIDAQGYLYIADKGNHAIRMISPDGLVSTIGGLPGYAGAGEGKGTRSQFNAPSSIAIDGEGNIYVADAENHRIMRGTPWVPKDRPRAEISTGGEITLSFEGVPKASYSIQRSAAMEEWSTLATQAADEAGLIEFTDAEPSAPKGFYRVLPL